MYLFIGSSSLLSIFAFPPGKLGSALNAIQSPSQIVFRLFAIGAVTGALAMIIVAAYSILAPRIRRYVSSLRMRRVHQSHRSPSNGRRSS